MFILATACRRYNIGVVGYAMMPTHIHIIVRLQLDKSRDYDLVEFRKFVRSNLALYVNWYWDLKGSRFCRDSIGDSIKILDAESEAAQLLYVELNGVSAGLGRRPEELDGAISQRRWLTDPKVIERPSGWFQTRTWNDEEELRLCVPELLESEFTPAEFRKWSSNKLDQALRRLHRTRKQAGLGYRTLRELELETPCFEAIQHSSADHSRAHLVGEDPAQKAVEFHNLRAFVRWHGRSLERARRGEQGVVFPPGTYLAAKKYGAKVAEPSAYQAPVRRRDEGTLEAKYRSQVIRSAELTPQRE